MTHFDCNEFGNGRCEGEVFERVPEASLSGMAFPWCDRHWDEKNAHYWQVNGQMYGRLTQGR